MRCWNLSSDDPLTLTLAADARLGLVNYFDDQIWELSLKSGDPPALAFQSSLGLRARWVRLFPRFIQKTGAVIDLADYHQPPRIHGFYPSAATVKFFPLEGLEVTCEYRVPGSKTAAGRISLHNHNRQRMMFRLEWAGLLNPLGDGDAFSTTTSGGQAYLRGRCGNLWVVCAMSGQVKAAGGANPALALNVDLAAGAERQVMWAFTTHTQEQGALAQAREVLNRRWDAEMARIELVNASQQVEIHTHSEAWDAALAFSQKTAFGLFYSNNAHLPYASFVLSREPDHGYSLRGDGSDYPVLWKGQTALDAFYLADLLLPGGVDLVKGLVRNFLSGQEVTGRIPWRPSLAGGRSSRLAQPLLATLAWEVFRLESDPAWISEVYPSLLSFIKVWFDPEHDRDGDSFPVWEDPLQTGLEDIPLYDRWHAHAQGIDITALESPALGALLYQELACLIKMAQALGQPEALPWLEEKSVKLREELLSSRDKASGRFHYRDAHTHQSPSGGRLKTFQGAGSFSYHKTFPIPRRIQLEYLPVTQATRPIQVKVSGLTPQGEACEEFQTRKWHWSSDKASATSQMVFTAIQQVEINGVTAEDQVVLSTIDYTQEDISLFLPLWANLLSPEQAARLVKSSLLTAYALPYGLPTCLVEQCPDDVPHLNAVSPLWNTFIIDGLLNYGQRDLAADLFSRMMDAVVLSLQEQHAFHEFYHAQTGAPIGDRNHLRGLAPVGLLLRILGIRKLTKNQIILDDFCPYPWPITVKYQGVEIHSHPTHAVVTFPNGQSACLSGPGPHQISLLPTPVEEIPDADAHLQVA